MTDVEMRAVEQIVVDRAQRLIVVLAAVHAARAAAIQHLTLDDLDLPNRRIAIAVRPSSPPVVAAVVDGRPGALRDPRRARRGSQCGGGCVGGGGADAPGCARPPGGARVGMA